MNCETPKVSIIVPVYNVEQYLPKCLDSLIGQTYSNIEIICVNDGSPDNSLQIIKDYALKDKRVICVDKENSGVSDTRNSAIPFVTGKYIIYVDSDDWIAPETCELAVAAAEENSADVVFWNYIREFENCSKPKKILGDEVQIFQETDIKNLQRRFVGLFREELEKPENANVLDTVWAKLYRADIISDNDLKFVDIKKFGTGEDAFFNLKLFSYVKKAVYLPKGLNHYRKNNITSITKSYKTQLRAQWDVLHSSIREYIKQNACDETYNEALNNRICLSVIGLGLNVLYCKSGLNKRREINSIISSDEYRKACKTLKLKYFPIHWKIFFFFAKIRFSLGVYGMLICIKKLKER